jgi:hypothetical protein
MSGAPVMGGSVVSVGVCAEDVAVEAARRVGVFVGLYMDFGPRPKVELRFIWVRDWQSVHASRWDELIRPCRVDVMIFRGVAERHKCRARRGAWRAILKLLIEESLKPSVGVGDILPRKTTTYVIPARSRDSIPRTSLGRIHLIALFKSAPNYCSS